MPKRDTTSRRSNLPKIVPVSQISNPRSFVFYGLPGTGKTTLAGSFPKPALLIDFNDKGTDSVSDVKDLDVAQVYTIDELEALYWQLQEGKLDYETVIIDTVTGMQQMIIADVTGAKESMKWGSMTRKQFGEVSATMKEMITNYRDLPLNMVFLAQQRVFNIDENDELSDDELPPEIGPAIMPSIATHLNAAVNVIGQTYIRLVVEYKENGKKKVKRERMQYCLYVGPNPVRTTKIRKPKSVVLPSFLINPVYKDLISIIKGDD